MTGAARRRRDATIRKSKRLSAFIERSYEGWAPRHGERDFFHLLREEAVSEEVVDRRGGAPSVRTLARAWARFGAEVRKRRERELALAAENREWEAAIDVRPSRAPQHVWRDARPAPAPDGTGPPVPTAKRTARTLDGGDADDEYIRQQILRSAGHERPAD